jgi:hypothetical protein
MSHVFQRAIWNGTPVEEATWWTLRKDRREATCRMFSHEFGHELRLDVGGEVMFTKVCRGDEEIISCQEGWRAALEAKGWTKT